MDTKQSFEALGTPRAQWQGNLETFPTPLGVSSVKYASDEVTAICPVTGQPDWYTVEIILAPTSRCIESKSLKLFLQSFRDQGHFCEAFAAIILQQIVSDTTPRYVAVTIKQKARGGVAIEARATWFEGEEK